MIEKRVDVTVTIGDAKVTLEGPESFVKEEVERLMAKLGGSQPTEPSVEAQPHNERELILTKQPRGHHETVAVIAYFLREKGTEEFTDEDIRRAYIRAGIKPPKVVAQAIRDARNKFDLIEGGSKRGMYRLSAHGERTVIFDLPHAGT